MGPGRGRKSELRARVLGEGHTTVPGPWGDKDNFSDHYKLPPPNPLHMAHALQCHCHHCFLSPRSFQLADPLTSI